MPARAISSHFLLLPGGGIGKWPLIQLSAEGKITGVELNNKGFSERPLVEFWSGLLIPGLIDCCRVDEEMNLPASYPARHHARGTLLMSIPGNTFKGGRPLVIEGANNIHAPHPALDRTCNKYLSPLLERITGYIKTDPGTSLQELLYLASEWGSKALMLSDQLGTLEPGKTPGIVQVEGLNPASFTSGSPLKVKWLVHGTIKT